MFSSRGNAGQFSEYLLYLELIFLTEGGGVVFFEKIDTPGERGDLEGGHGWEGAWKGGGAWGGAVNLYLNRI